MSEAQFADGKVVGQLDNGVFFQRITERHIIRIFDGKGIDLGLYRQLKGKCHTWLVEFKDIHKLISIPYDRIALSGHEWEPGKGVARQMVVPLRYFDEDRPASQRRML